MQQASWRCNFASCKVASTGRGNPILCKAESSPSTTTTEIVIAATFFYFYFLVARGPSREFHKTEQGNTNNYYIYIFFLFVIDLCSPKRGWAVPRSSAILGQPAERAKQASVHVPDRKN